MRAAGGFRRNRIGGAHPPTDDARIASRTTHKNSDLAVLMVFFLLDILGLDRFSTRIKRVSCCFLFVIFRIGCPEI